MRYRVLPHLGIRKLENISFIILPVFFLLLADSTLAYIFPILVEGNVSSNFILGIIMAASSFAGLLCDFSFPIIFKNRTWKVQIFLAVVLSFSFLISTIFGAKFSLILLFLLGAIMWGVYYELMSFAEQNFIVHMEKKDEYSRDWSLIFLFTNITGIIGPILGASLIGNNRTSLIVIIFLQFISLAATILCLYRFRKMDMHNHKITIIESVSAIKELKTWRILLRFVYPAVIMGVTTELVEATFWTLGGLLGQDLFKDNSLGWVPMILYSIPMIIGSFILFKLNFNVGKKRIGQILLLFSGIFLALIIPFENHTAIVCILLFTSSILGSLPPPLNEAVYSDLLKRSKGVSKGELLGLAKANSSFAYIIGPLFVGLLADNVGYVNSFGLVGVFVIFVSVILLLTTPRKLRLPQAELSEMGKS